MFPSPFAYPVRSIGNVGAPRAGRSRVIAALIVFLLAAPATVMAQQGFGHAQGMAPPPPPPPQQQLGAQTGSGPYMAAPGQVMAAPGSPPAQ